MRRTKKNSRPAYMALGVALTFGAAGAARAQDGDTYGVSDDARPAQTYPNSNVSQNDPVESEAQPQGPVRLARFAYSEGAVTWREDESAAWSDATVNLPIRQGAQIWVAEHGRAEIQFDDGSLLRLGGGALVTLQTLYSDADGEFTEIKLNQGIASLRVRTERSVYQLDTPYVSVKSSGPSKLRVGAGESVEVAVREGDAAVEGSQGRADLHAGDFLALDNPDAVFAIRHLPRDDSWERWNEERDAYLSAAAERPSQRYLPENVAIVAPDLDTYGTWRDDPEYGEVWCPRVVEADWRPYSAGRWTWVQPFGWTWVSSEAWGWAPYHYGTWCHRAYGWAWCPGPVTQYWSPAVVHFTEYNGGVAWCPLAPHEVRYPSALTVGFRGGAWSLFFSIGQAAVYYPTGRRYCEARPWNSNYVNRVTNVTNVTNINVTNVYNNNRFVTNHNGAQNIAFTPTNAQFANGATSASLAAFSGRGAYRAMQRSEAVAFTEGRAVVAPQAGQRPVAGPTLAKPTAFSTSPTRTLTPGAGPSLTVSNRRIFRAPLPQQVQRGTGTPQPGRAPQSGSSYPGGSRGGLQPNQTRGGSTGNGGRVQPGGSNGAAQGGTQRGYTGEPGGVTRNPNRSNGTERRPEGNSTSTPGLRRSSPDGNGGGTAGSNGADRARAARQSVGFGRGYGGPNGTYRQDPNAGRSGGAGNGSGTQSAPRPGYGRPTDTSGGGRGATGNGASGGSGANRTYSPRPAEPTRSEPAPRSYTPPTRTYEPTERRNTAPPRSAPQTERRDTAPQTERRPSPGRSEPARRDSGGGDKSKSDSGGPKPGRGR